MQISYRAAATAWRGAAAASLTRIVERVRLLVRRAHELGAGGLVRVAARNGASDAATKAVDGGVEHIESECL